jgi:serine/threonine-protein kinase RsbW
MRRFDKAIGRSQNESGVRMRRDAQFLCDVSAIASSSLTRAVLADGVAKASVTYFCALCAVHALDNGGTLSVLAIADRREHQASLAETAFALALGSREGFIQEVLRSGQPLLFHRNASRDSLVEESAQRLLQVTDTRSLMVVPISAGSASVGAISFLEAYQGERFSSADMDRGLAVGRQLSIALENLKYREQERRITERSRFLARATNQLFTTSDSDEMLRLLLNAVVEEIADWAVVVSLSKDALNVIATAESPSRIQPGLSRLREGRVFSEPNECTFIDAVRRQRPLQVNEISRSPAAEGTEATEEMQPRSWMMAPLFVGGRDFSAVISYSASSPADDGDFEILQELCRRTSLALEYAESLARERRLTQTLQQATLPSHLAEVEGATLSAVYLPAAGEEQVGGDWYDAYSLDDDRVLLTVGDVTGHGLQASVVMGKLRHALNVVAMYEADPVRVLDVAERIVLRRYPEAVATAFVAIIDTRRKTVTYANAGHPYPMLRYADGSMRFLAAEGLPIGLRYLHPSQTRRTDTLDGVEVMLLYTDGLTEANRDALEGERRVERALLLDAVRVVSDPADFIKRSCLPRPSADDVAILALNFVTIDRWKFESTDQAAAQQARIALCERLRAGGLKEDDCAAAEFIFGELAANVARHAPGVVDVALEQCGSRPILHVIDNGVGYDPAEFKAAELLAESGRGLWLIRRLGGDLHVEMLPGHGAHTRVALPVDAARRDERLARSLQPA